MSPGEPGEPAEGNTRHLPPHRLADLVQGESLRARGLALPLCWLPPPEPLAELGPLPGRRADGKLWFE
jgi:hypothetical protein